jgi:hypothetical protein
MGTPTRRGKQKTLIQVIMKSLWIAYAFLMREQLRFGGKARRIAAAMGGCCCMAFLIAVPLVACELWMYVLIQNRRRRPLRRRHNVQVYCLTRKRGGQRLPKRAFMI